MPLNQSLFDATVELHLDIERVALSVRGEVIDLLKNLEQELIAKVANGVTDWSKARIAKQISEAEAIIRQYYDDAAGVMRDSTTEVAQVSASATAESLSVAVGGQVAIGVLPTATYFETLAGNAIIQGAVQSAWWARQSQDTTFKFQTAVRQGLVAAETNQQIVKRVLDVTDLSKRNAQTLVHTSIQTVANDARLKTFEDNADVVSGNEWIATLDRKTCPVCGALDGKKWKLGDTALKKPPKHWRCRCSLVPELKSWKELGINLPDLPDGTRASMDGQVTDTSFESWLKRKEASAPGFADNTLGKGRAEMWKSGKITLDQMINGAKPMSLKDLKAKYNGVQSVPMTLDEIYKRAEKVKPEFDAKIKSVADKYSGNAMLTELKSKERAIAKINYEHAGDPSKINDILRSSVVLGSVSQLNNAFESAINDFNVVSFRNGYLGKVHSSDGYFDAKLDVNFSGVLAEIQFHTESMWQAKEKAHDLYVQRQDILRTLESSKLSKDQKAKISDINKKMREIFRKAGSNE